MQKLTFFNYVIKNNSDSESCDIFIDGTIVDASTEQFIKDWWNDDTPTSFKNIRTKINEAKAKTINVYVNSGGGQVIEAMAIHDYLKSMELAGKTVNTFGRGLIASAATYILMASSKSTISENSWFMVHNVSGGVYGNVNEIENYAVTMRKFNDQITQFYSAHTGLSSTVIGNMMNKETWMDGKEAVAKGFVKNLESSQTFSNSIPKEKWLFNNTEVLNAYNHFTNKNPENMDFKKLGDDLKNSIIDHLKSIGVIKNDTDTSNLEGIATAVENALKPINEEVDTKISNAVKDATKDLGTSISNAVTEAMKNLATKDDLKNLASTQSLTDELKKVTDELDLVKEGIANKKTGEAGAGGNNGANNKSEFEHEGVTWGK